MLVVICVTFLFAPGMPILFPIALLGMIVQYSTNRVQLAYLRHRPPVYDNKMNTSAIIVLENAPVFYVLMGAWLYSN